MKKLLLVSMVMMFSSSVFAYSACANGVALPCWLGGFLVCPGSVYYASAPNHTDCPSSQFSMDNGSSSTQGSSSPQEQYSSKKNYKENITIVKSTKKQENKRRK